MGAYPSNSSRLPLWSGLSTGAYFYRLKMILGEKIRGRNLRDLFTNISLD